MVRLSEGGSGGTTSVVIKKPAVMPKNPYPAPKKDSAWTQSKKIQGAAEVTKKTGKTPSYSQAPVSKNPLTKPSTKGAGSNGTLPTTVTTKERAAAFNTDKNGRPIYNGTKTSRDAQNSWDASHKSSGGGGSSSGTKSTTTTATTPAKPTVDPAQLASIAKLNDLWNQASGYKGQIDDMMKTGFSYDPSTDASYKALSQLATKQAKVASGEAMETMNDRGILNSTVTGDRLGQIEQTAQDAVIAQIPQLKQASYGQYMDKLSTLNNLWNSTTAQAQQERAFGEDKRRWDLGYQMDVDQFNTSKDQWNKTFDYNKSQDAIKNDLAQGQLALDYQNYDLNYAKNMQSQIGVNNKQATNAAIAELVTGKDKASIVAQFQANASKYYNAGVNLSEVLSALNKYYPGLEDDVNKSMSGKNMFSK
jgi:hypothetical protein